MFILILLCTFGPLSAFKISVNAQLHELEELFDGYNKTDFEFNAVYYNRFGSIIRYLYDRNAIDKTEAYFGFNPNEAFSETGGYNLPRKIIDSLGIKVERDSINAIETAWIRKNYRIDTHITNFTEEITEYTNFTMLQLDSYEDDEKALQLSLNNRNIISLRYYGDILFETNLTSQLKAVADKYDYLSQATTDEFTFRLKNDKGDFLIIFQEINYDYKEKEVNILNGSVLLFYRTYEGLELP
jgi:hypothetical protein